MKAKNIKAKAIGFSLKKKTHKNNNNNNNHNNNKNKNNNNNNNNNNVLCPSSQRLNEKSLTTKLIALVLGRNHL